MTATILKLNEGEAPAASPETLRARALARSFAEAPAEEILRRALREEFAGRIALVSSFGAESSVLLHLVSRIAPETPVIFLDTGKHFAQTLGHRRKLASALGLTDVRDILPDRDDLEASDPKGNLWRSDADACCDIRKVRPLASALEGFDAWITGRKAFHSTGRMQLPAAEWTGGRFKVNPLVRWSPDDIEGHMAAHELPRHPLVEQGYPSIGCWPCTRPVGEGEAMRAGRWSADSKEECGIHLR